jgi:hypothetical protein
MLLLSLLLMQVEVEAVADAPDRWLVLAPVT